MARQRGSTRKRPPKRKQRARIRPKQRSSPSRQEPAADAKGSQPKTTPANLTAGPVSWLNKSYGSRDVSAAVVPDPSNEVPPAAEQQETQAGAGREQLGLRLEWWEADRLQPHPQNWRRHPPRQKEAVARLLSEVGWAGALLYNERTGRLLDGHLRKELCRGQRVPVLVGNWSEEQERQIVALLDPLTALAGVDVERWQELLQSLADMDARLALALESFARDHGVSLPEETLAAVDSARPPADLPEARFEVIVECQDEASQRDLYERLSAEGYRCRVLTF